jgi:NADPH:quinone reductase-like Zn-dependent oxidoreductase
MYPLDLPAGLGSDVAGAVDSVGEGVTGFAVGGEVLGASLTPSYAQFALADPVALVAKPASVTWEVAGSLAGAAVLLRPPSIGSRSPKVRRY